MTKPGMLALLSGLWLGSTLCVPAQSQSSTASPRATYNFNPGWKVFVGDSPEASAESFDDAAWKPVTLPYAWNEDSAFKVGIAQLPTGIAWYRKHFKLPAGSAGGKVFLEFEGLRQAGEFYLNGKHVGRHENGVMAVGFDVTEFIRPAPQENVIAVRTDNSWDYREQATSQRYQWADRNFNANYGGIPKNVKLHVVGKLYQTLPLYSNLGTKGVYIYAQDFDLAGKAATITAESEVRNDYDSPRTFSYDVVVEDMEGKPVRSFRSESATVPAGQTVTARASGRMDNLKFWSWGYGYLYTVRTILKVDGRVVDSVRTRTGFRKTEFANGLIKLNGRVLQMKGYAQRTSNEWPAQGMDVPPWMSDFSNDLIVEDNGNLIRWMHITPSKQDVESCDRVGLIEAMPAGDSEADVTGRRWGQRVEVMRDAIIYHRNHPSILFYESGNENISEEHMSEMKALRDQFDPHGGRAAGSREMLDSRVAEYGGEMLYINKSARLPFWATEYSRDEGLRKYWDDWTPPFHKDGEGPLYRNAPATDYNRNQDSHAIEDVTRWYDYWRERPGTGVRVSSGGVNIIFSDSNTHQRGAENYRRSGEVDAMRLPKEGFFAHRVMWDGWVDVERPRIHIIGHWNYAPDVKKPVYVVSSADRVELFVNQQSKGFGAQSSRFLYTWKEIQFQPGEIMAVGYDADGKKLCEAVKKTAGDPVALKLTPHTGPAGLRADGADLAFVDVEVVDARGARCPTALNLVRFDLQGPAEWRGGIAQGPDNYILSKELPVECGVNRVMLRSRPQAGRIVLNASSEGLKPAKVELASSAFVTADGLAVMMPDDGLRSRLDRGPTPPGDSFKLTRKAVPIVRATAGTNAGQAMLSFDDNERTSWKNDGRRETGWIQYELERSALVNEVTMKMGGWRTKSYPIRIFVDGKEAFTGTTPKGLGYVTLALKPTAGKVVRIEFTGETQEGDAFGQMVEVTGRRLEDGVSVGIRGALEIVEVEIYEPLDAVSAAPQRAEK